MNWSNVKLIYQREFRDQLRDRRTLFTILVLPLLLYPLLGMSFLQVAQFMQVHPTTIRLIGASELPADPPLLEGDRFSSALVSEEESRLIRLSLRPPIPADETDSDFRELAERWIRRGECDVVVYFPHDFADKLQDTRRQFADGPTANRPLENEPLENDSAKGTGGARPDTETIAPIEPILFVDTSQDRSNIARDRVERILSAWRAELVRDSLREHRLPESAIEPFFVTGEDVSHEETRRAVVWSKVLPFVVLVWALTGAFYPAVDLCAGEKERGTLETLLSSPARRSEIVWGKLLTVATFSMVTSLLNLFSMGLTGTLLMRQMTPLGNAAVQIGSPPWTAIVWLVAALVPMSALFSALSLAIAAFARSSKEGQYYLMPLLMIMLPLMMLPILPATELNLGTSLIPVTGVMLVLRSLVEGEYREALTYLPPVLAVTGVGCWLAIGWAVRQFNNEAVLFRESERWELRHWLRQLVRDRRDLPTVGEAVLCGVLILVMRFFAQLAAPPMSDWSGIATTTLVLQIGLIAAPALLMATMLTLRPLQSLRLGRTRWIWLPAAPLLAVGLHPLLTTVGRLVQLVYPMSGEMIEAVAPFMEAIRGAPLWSVLLVIAVAPAVCEELAFRGFVLSGLQRTGRNSSAILWSAAFFGAAHAFLQQQITAFLVGLVIGTLAVRARSLWPCMLFHATHNSLAVLMGRLGAESADSYRFLSWIYDGIGEDAMSYRTGWVIASSLLAAGIAAWLWWTNRAAGVDRSAASGGSLHEATRPPAAPSAALLSRP